MGASPGMVGTNQALQGATSAIVHQTGALANPTALLTTPQHLIRYWTDVERRHGPAAMIEAMGPSLAAGLGAAILTHSPDETEEAAIAAGEAVGGDTEAEAGAEGATPKPEPTPAQKTGVAVRNAVTTVAKPVASAVGGVARGMGYVSTSPAALAGEGAGVASAHVIFPDSYQRTASSSYLDPVTHQPVSFGRDIASLLHLQPHTGGYTAVSGALDALFDVSVPDPIGASGRVYGIAHSAEGGGRVLGRFFGGTTALTPEDVDRVLQQYPSKRNAIKFMDGMSPGDIAHQWPAYAPLSQRLADAGTYEGRVEVFKDAARTQELTTTSEMPGLTRYAKVKGALGAHEAQTSALPTMMDSEINNFSPTKFKIGDPNAVPSIMRFFRMIGENQRVSSDVGSTLLATHDPRVWETTLANAYKTALGRAVQRELGGGHPELATAIQDAIEEHADNYFGGRGAGFDGEFGLDDESHDLSMVHSNDPANEQSRSAALFLNQSEEGTLPDLRNFKQQARQLAQMEDWTVKRGFITKGSAFKTFVDHWVNDMFFKPLALLTGGWAVRVSTSEAILNMLRHGPLNYTAASIASSLAKQDFKLANDNEMGHFVAAIRGLMAGTDAAALKGLAREKYLDAAVAATYLNDGHIVAPGLDAKHALPLKGTDEPDRLAADISAHEHQYKVRDVPLSNNFTMLAPRATGYFRAWSEYAGRISADGEFGQKLASDYLDALDHGLNKEAATAIAIRKGRSYLEAMPKETLDNFLRSSAMSKGSTTDPLTDWAAQAVNAIRGTVYGPDGTLHKDLLKDIVDGTVPDLRTMAGRYGKLNKDSLPRTVGREVRIPQWDGLRILAAKGHAKVLGPIVNSLSREPTFVLDFAKERDLLANKVKLGEMTQDQADSIAQTRAVTKAIRFVHNPQDKLKIEQTIGLVAPFYFAQNQAIRRAGRLFATNPGAFEQYLKLMLQVQNVSYQITQKNGQSSFIVPGTTVAGAGVTQLLGHLGVFTSGSIPIGLSGSVDSMQTIFPWSGNAQLPGSPQTVETALKPSVGPIAAIPLKAVQDLFSRRAPALSNAASAALGPVGASQPFWTQALPNSIIEHIVQSAPEYFTVLAGGSLPHEFASSYNSALLGVMAGMADNEMKANPQAFANMADNPQQQAAFIRKADNLTAILWLARTVVSGVSPVSVSLGQANLKLSDEVQAEINAHHGNITAGLNAFLDKNPDALPSTVYKSTDPLGSPFPDTAAAGKWITDNNGLINKYPYAARYLLPTQDARGNFDYGTYETEIAEGLRHTDTPQDFLNQIYISAGNQWYFNVLKPKLDQALAADPGDESKIYDQEDQFVKQYGALNPIWLTSWNAYATQTNRLETVRQMRQMLTGPDAPTGQQADHLRDVLQVYDLYQGQKATSAEPAAQLKAAWEAKMNQAAKDFPDIAPAITDVFARLG